MLSYGIVIEIVSFMRKDVNQSSWKEKKEPTTSHPAGPPPLKRADILVADFGVLD